MAYASALNHSKLAVGCRAERDTTQHLIVATIRESETKGKRQFLGIGHIALITRMRLIIICAAVALPGAERRRGEVQQLRRW